MREKVYSKIFINTFVFIIGLTIGTAQPVSVRIWRDSIQTVVGKTFTNRLTLNNTAKYPQEVNLSVQIPACVQLLSSIPNRLVLAPGEVIAVPVKGLVNRQSPLPVNQIELKINNLTGQNLQTVSFQLVVVGKSHAPVSLYALEETLVLFAGTEPVHLPLRLVHNQTTSAKFSVEVTSLPEGVDRTFPPLSISLLSQQDTTLSLDVKPWRRWSTEEPYQLVVTLRDERQSIVGSVFYKLVIAVSRKRYTDSPTNGNGGYGASVALTRFSTNQLAKETSVWGTDSIGKAHLDFQVRYSNYGSNHLQQLQNTYLSLRTNWALLRVGSLYDYHELPMFGRGAKVSIRQADNQWTFWAVNSTPDWLNIDANAWSGNVFSARFDRKLTSLPGASYSLSSSNYTQAGTMRAGYLTFASFQYNLSDRHALSILGGGSTEFARSGSDRAQTTGWTGQVEYSYQSPKIAWQFRSYLSSPVYSGIQKGARLVYSQFFWQLAPRTAVVARLNLTQYDRVLFTNSVEYNRHTFGNTVAEVSVNQRVSQVTLSLRPYWFSQSDLSNPFSQRSDAYRLVPAIAYRRRSYQHADLSYDAGIFFNRSAPSQTGVLSHRLISSIAMGPFSFWGYWQRGPYYLFDLRSSHPSQIMTTSLTPTVNFSMLNRRLWGSAGLNYLYDGSTDQSRYTAVGRVQFDVTPNFTLNLTANGTPYSQQPEFAYSQYRLEVTKRFNRLKTSRYGQLQLSFFQDDNGNGSKDSGERWMDSLLVSVNENTLLTDARGAITYRNIPPDTYRISVLSTGRVGDPVLYNEQIIVGRSVAKIIGLSRTFRVNGLLRCMATVYDNQPCQFSRFIIEIHRDQQLISSVNPLPDGSFVLHLLSGKYTLYVRDYGRETRATVKTASFTLSETGQHPVFDWTIDGSTRPVDIKRFTQK